MAESLAIFLLKCFYLMLPAYFANMAPVIVKKIDLLAFPVDFNKKIDGKPILGKNKTYRGIIFGIVFAIFIAYLQFSLYRIPFFNQISFVDYQNWLLFGLLMGAGALTGDLVKSFFKRRLNINPGMKFLTDLNLIFVAIGMAVGLVIFLALLIFQATL